MTSFGDFNLYDELEINKEAIPEEIKKAYKKLAMVLKKFIAEMASGQKLRRSKCY